MSKVKIFSIVIIMLAMVQTTFAAEKGLGIKAGANFSKNGFIAGDTKFQPGLTLGLTYQVKAAKVFAFEIGGLYHWKRSTAEDFSVEDISYDNFKNSFHFVEIPVVLKFYPMDWFNVNFGPYVSYVIAAKAEGIDRIARKQYLEFN
ncbi:MAG: outer membrane beta-barrel protein [Chitinophagales bacterium]